MSWLNRDAPVDEELLSRPPGVRDVRVREVSAMIDNVRNNGPELMEPDAASARSSERS